MPTRRRPHLPAGRGRGQSVVEFALVLPVILMITVAVLDGARLFSAHITLTNAAREGALYAARRSTAGQAEVAAFVAAETSDLDQASLTVDPPVRTLKYVTVKLTYPMALMTPLLGNLWGSPMMLTATTTAPLLE